jgi:VanZ family protein
MPRIISPFNVMRWAACLFYSILVVYLSLMSSRALSDFAADIPCEDKIGHFGVYGLYAALLLWTIRGGEDFSVAVMRRQEALIVAYCSAFGILMEILQGTLCHGDRWFEVGDILADIAGALTFTVLVRLLTRQRQSAAQQTPVDAGRSD